MQRELGKVCVASLVVLVLERMSSGSRSRSQLRQVSCDHTRTGDQDSLQQGGEGLEAGENTQSGLDKGKTGEGN